MKVRRALLGVLLGVLVCGTAPPSRPLAAGSPSWPMVGHDPQRTYRADVVGPTHPHLLWSRTGAIDRPVVGADGSIYTWTDAGLLALDSSGKQRWFRPAILFDGGPPALTSDGTLIAAGFTSEPISPEVAAVFAVGPTGTLRWKVQPSDFSKGAAPLTVGMETYVPFVGPTKTFAGLGHFSKSGTRRTLQSRFSFFDITRAKNGSLYAIGRYASHQDFLSVERISHAGRVLWHHRLPYASSISLLITRDGTVVASSGQNVTGEGTGTRIAAYSQAGKRLWHVDLHIGLATIAERGDGVLLAAGETALVALRAQGTVLWTDPLGRSAYEPASISVDSTGRAYVGSGARTVSIVRTDGSIEATIASGGKASLPSVPQTALGPDGRLLVTGTDNVLRAYGD